MKSVLITGGTGFLGRHLVDRLLADPEYERICIYSRDEVKQWNMRRDFGDDARLRWLIGDVRDRDRLRRAMEGVHAVIHAAALKRIEVGFYNPIEMVKTNVLGTLNVIEAATDAHVSRVVFISSDKAYQPVSAYGFSKALAENIVLAANNTRGFTGPRFSAVRYGNVSGSTGSVIPHWLAAKERGEVAAITDPDCTRFHMRIDAAVDLVLRAVCDAPEQILIPVLPAYRLGDLAEAIGVKTRVVGLASWEKKHESMCEGRSSDTARRMTVDELREALVNV